jgi:hypothetical protein
MAKKSIKGGRIFADRSGLFLALLLLIAFFLPWFKNPSLIVRGFNIHNWINFFKTLQPLQCPLAILIYCIPLGCLLIFLFAYLKIPSGVLEITVGMLAPIVTVVLLFKNVYLLPQIQPGFILAVIVSILLLISGANK